MANDNVVDASDADALSDDGYDTTASTDDSGDDWDDDSGDGWDDGSAASGDDSADAGDDSYGGSADGDAFLTGADVSGTQNALAGFTDPAESADPQRARVVGWYAICMFVADGGRACGYREYAMDENGAQAKKNSHIATNPTHANAVVVQEST